MAMVHRPPKMQRGISEQACFVKFSLFFLPRTCDGICSGGPSTINNGLMVLLKNTTEIILQRNILEKIKIYEKVGMKQLQENSHLFIRLPCFPCAQNQENHSMGWEGF